MKKVQKTLVSSMAALASVASIIAPTASVLAAETVTVAQVKELIANAGKAKTAFDYNTALIALEKLPAADQPILRAELAKLFDVCMTSDVKAVLNGMLVLTTKWDLPTFHGLEEQIAKTVTNPVNKGYLQNELNFWGKTKVYTADVVKAVDAVNKAWTSKTQADIEAAKVLVGQCTNAQNITYLNGEVAKIAKLADVYVTSTAAVDATTVRVNFSTEIKDVDFTNFAVNNGLTVIKATLSADKKSVDVKVNTPFVRTQEYTVTTSGIAREDGKAAAELTGKFVWSVDLGVTVSLESTSLTIGDTAAVVVKDQDAKDITAVSTVSIESSNTNIVSENNVVITAVAAGTANVTVTVTLADGTILTKVFPVTVASATSNVVNQGFTLVTAIASAPENTVAFNNGTKTTTLTAGTSKEVAMYDTANSNPLTTPVSFTGATVRSINPVIATAAISSGVLTVTANAGQEGTASFEVTFANNTKRTFTVTVKKAPVLTGVKVSETTVKLSDEEINGASNVIEGVNAKTVTVTLIDQYGDGIATPTTTWGKVTVTSNTNGIEIKDAIGGAVFTNNELVIADNGDGDGVDTFTLIAKKDTVVNGKVYVKYFKNDTDATPTVTKEINVSTVNVKSDATKVGLDITAASQIDVNAANTSSTTDVSSINFGSADVFVLDASGNRLEKVTATAALVGTNDYVTVSGSTLQFQGNDELTLMTKNGSVNVDVTAAGITKRLAVAYINSASIPASATVNTSPVAVKLGTSDTTLTVEELIFGALKTSDLILDAEMSEYIAVKNAVTSGGYLYNKPLVSFKNAAGAALVTGASVYGIESATTTGNVWFDEDQTKGYSAESFAVDYTVANITTTGSATFSPTGSLTGDTVSITNAGDTVTFTLVIKSVYVTGASATDNNLLAAPVTVNVTVTK
jgi:hypothetical protein